jgi:hypothetical protein
MAHVWTSAEDNVRILDRVQSQAALVYYDVGNSHTRGFEVVKEIRWLGRQRICQGFANLETTSPSKDIEQDMRRNLQYIRGLM